MPAPIVVSAEEFLAKYARHLKRPAMPKFVDRRPPTKLPVRFDLPMPPSENKLWATVKDRTTGRLKRVLTDDARAYARSVAPILGGLRLVEGRFYQLHWLIQWPWYFKNGKLRAWDAMNRVKFLQDLVAQFGGADDKHFREPRYYEINRPVEAVRLAITPWSASDLPALLV